MTTIFSQIDDHTAQLDGLVPGLVPSQGTLDATLVNEHAQTVYSVCQDLVCLYEKAWKELIGKLRDGKLGNVDRAGRELFDRLGDVNSIFVRAARFYPFDFKEARDLSNRIIQIQQELGQQWPWRDNRLIANSRAYFEQGEEGNDVRDILDELRG